MMAGNFYPVDFIGTSPLDSDFSVDSAATCNFSKDRPGKLLLFAFKIKV